MSHKTLKNWWTAPKDINADTSKVSTLELFFDVGFTAYFSRLAISYANDFSIVLIGKFILLFTLGWWTWYSISSYHVSYGHEDSRHRIFTFIQMFFLILMAIYSPTAFGQSSFLFSMSYLGILVINVYFWIWTCRKDPNNKEALGYTISLLIALLFIVVSLMVPTYVRIYLWTASLLTSMASPLLIRISFHKGASKVARFVMSETLRKRFTRLTFILIGQIIGNIIYGVLNIGIDNPAIYLLLVLGFTVVVLLYTLYIDFIDNKEIKDNRYVSYIYVIIHLVLSFNICLIGAMYVEYSNIYSSVSSLYPLQLFSSAVASICFCLGLFNLIARTPSSCHSKNLFGILCMISAVLAIFTAIYSTDLVFTFVSGIVVLFIPTIVNFANLFKKNPE